LKTHTFSVSERGSGRFVAEYDGISVAKVRGSAAFDLARQMLASGAEDGPVEARGPDGRLHWTSPSLAALARSAIREDDRGGPRVIRYRPGFADSSTTGSSHTASRGEGVSEEGVDPEDAL